MQIKEVNVIFVALLLFGQEQMATRWEELRRREVTWNNLHSDWLGLFTLPLHCDPENIHWLSQWEPLPLSQLSARALLIPRSLWDHSPLELISRVTETKYYQTPVLKHFYQPEKFPWAHLASISTSPLTSGSYFLSLVLLSIEISYKEIM